jgi:hypothetical protein
MDSPTHSSQPPINEKATWLRATPPYHGTAKADLPPLRPCALHERGHAVLQINRCQARDGGLTSSDAGERSVQMANDRKTFDVGRDSKNGQFIPVKEADHRPNTTTVERVPKPGYGDTKSK